TVVLRIPGWCEQHSLAINGAEVAAPVVKGYARLKRTWQSGDMIQLDLPMPVTRIYADPRVQANNGRVALQRGPLVYCLEGVDNGSNLSALQLPRDAELSAASQPDLLGGVV